MPEMFVMLIKFLLLSDVFNVQKAHFFHFYPTDLVKLILKKISPSGSVNSARCIPWRFMSWYISTTIHLPFEGQLYIILIIYLFYFRGGGGGVLVACPTWQSNVEIK